MCEREGRWGRTRWVRVFSLSSSVSHIRLSTPLSLHPRTQLLVTTSRDPSSRLTQFAKELRLVLPNATRLNRGGTVVADLVASARAHDFTDVVVLHEHRGQPDGLVVCHLPFGPTAYFGVYNAVR